MRFATLAAAFSTPLLVAAVPTKYRRAKDIDIKVVLFADTLERLEGKFYSDGLNKFNSAAEFEKAGFSNGSIPLETLGDILTHETNHTTFLDGVLKVSNEEPIANCSFNFDAIIKDVPTFIGIGRLLEVVGIGAYLGGANAIVDKSILVAAATILTIEARHSSSMNTLSGTVAVPQSFDTPLSPNQVVGLALPFLDQCQGLKDLFPPNVPLTVTNANNFVVNAGDKLTFDRDDKQTFCQIFVGDGGKPTVLPFNECTAPKDAFGSLVIFQTSSDKPLDNAAILANDPAIVAGPAITFINKVDSLGNLVFPGTPVQSSSDQANAYAAAATPVPSSA
jgi:hypothetical protein